MVPLEQLVNRQQHLQAHGPEQDCKQGAARSTHRRTISYATSTTACWEAYGPAAIAFGGQFLHAAGPDRKTLVHSLLTPSCLALSCLF